MFNKPMKILVISSSLILLSGCIPGVSPLGNRTYSINCTGWPMSLDTCYQAARSHCPNGFIVLSKQPTNIANITLSAQALAPDRVHIRGMVVRCR